MALRAILFDHDGTLVDSEPVHLAIWQAVLARYGVSLTEQQYMENYVGVPTRANSIDLVRRFGLSLDPHELAQAKNSATQVFLSQSAFPLKQGVLDAILEFRQKGLRLAVVSGSSSDAVYATISNNKLAEHFEAVVSADDVLVSKPDPACYALAIERLRLGAADCIAIEDTQPGLEAAHAAGVRCLVLPGPMSLHQEFEHATAVLDGMAAAVDFVRQLAVSPRR